MWDIFCKTFQFKKFNFKKLTYLLEIFTPCNLAALEGLEKLGSDDWTEVRMSVFGLIQIFVQLQGGDQPADSGLQGDR